MTTIETSPGAVAAASDEYSSAVGRLLRSVAGWVTATDHKLVGRLFVVTSMLALTATAVVGVLLGVERSAPDDTVLDAGALPQLFSAFRVGLVFGAMVPLLLGLAVAVVPLQVGARSLAFGRLAAAGFWAWAAGLVIVVVALANNGGPGGGDAQMVDLFLAGHALLAIGLTAVAGCVATTVLTTRAPGMTMRRMPVFAWSALIASIGLVLTLPVLVGAFVYQFVDHRIGSGAAFGGTDGIASWIGWAFTQPTTYVFALPAVGIALELLFVTFHRRATMRGFLFAGLALVGVGALAGTTQQLLFELPWTGGGLDLDRFGRKFQDLLPFAIFYLLPVLGVLMVMGLGALSVRGARPRLSGAFAFGFLGLGMLFVGMLGGVLYPILDLDLVGTVFEEGVQVYVVYGSALAGLGGVAHWAPKLWGRALPNGPVLGLAGLGILATVLASLPYYIAGFADQPASAGSYSIDGPAELWNVLVTVGHGLMALTVLAFGGLALRTFTAADGQPAGDDPWDGQTLEWATSSPAPRDNFADVASVSSAEPLLDLKPARTDA